MKKTLITFLAISLNALNINTLFNTLEKQPETKLDNLQIKKTKNTKKSILSSLYPKINIFSSATHYSEDVSLVPLTPTESSILIKTNKSIPFSQNILKVGFNFSMPIFIKSIYENKKKLNFLIKASKYKQKLNLLKREATLVTLISNLNYLLQLKKALIAQKNSISTTLNAIQIGVKNGRIPEFKALRLKDEINQIKIKIYNLNSKIEDIKSQIFSLTKISINQEIKIKTFNIKEGDFFSLNPLKENIIAQQKDIDAKKANYYPKVFFKIDAYRAFAKAYNTNKNIAYNLASAGIYINLEFDKKLSTEIEKSKLEYKKSILEYEKTKKELIAQITYINHSLKEIKKAISSQLNSIRLKKELLKSAKIAFKMNEMSVDEYLTYENNLLNAKANLYNLIATKNSLIAQKAMIYGKNLKKVFK